MPYCCIFGSVLRNIFVFRLNKCWRLGCDGLFPAFAPFWLLNTQRTFQIVLVLVICLLDFIVFVQQSFLFDRMNQQLLNFLFDYLQIIFFSFKHPLKRFLHKINYHKRRNVMRNMPSEIQCHR